MVAETASDAVRALVLSVFLAFLMPGQQASLPVTVIGDGPPVELYYDALRNERYNEMWLYLSPQMQRDTPLDEYVATLRRSITGIAAVFPKQVVWHDNDQAESTADVLIIGHERGYWIASRMTFHWRRITRQFIWVITAIDEQ